jgi:hypothetical protein
LSLSPRKKRARRQPLDLPTWSLLGPWQEQFKGHEGWGEGGICKELKALSASDSFWKSNWQQQPNGM